MQYKEVIRNIKVHVPDSSVNSLFDRADIAGDGRDGPIRTTYVAHRVKFINRRGPSISYMIYSFFDSQQFERYNEK